MEIKLTKSLVAYHYFIENDGKKYEVIEVEDIETGENLCHEERIVLRTKIAKWGDDDIW